jgi:hypothetical protein
VVGRGDIEGDKDEVVRRWCGNARLICVEKWDDCLEVDAGRRVSCGTRDNGTDCDTGSRNPHPSEKTAARDFALQGIEGRREFGHA